MRSLVGVLIGAALLFVVYHFYLKRMPATDEGTAPTQAISLTGVRSDLLQIAQAERGYIASNGHCASFDELISSNSLSMTRTERDGYSHTVECSGGELDRKSTRLNSSHQIISYAVFCLKKKNINRVITNPIHTAVLTDT